MLVTSALAPNPPTNNAFKCAPFTGLVGLRSSRA